MSVRPWMFECPRSAFMPPPRTPMLPSRSCSIAMQRMFCEPFECCVQPSAYIEVIVFVFEDVSAIISHTFRNLSFGVPQMRSTMSGVYCATCAFSRFQTLRGWSISDWT